jgi:hypothetical protein
VRRYRWDVRLSAGAIGVLLVGAPACSREPSAAELGRDCGALQAAAGAAAACDPALAQLAVALAERPDEAACRAAVRTLLAPPAAEPAIRSALATPPLVDASPLRDDELAALADLPRPAELVLVPDVKAAPGIPPTSAELDGAALEPDELGRLRVLVAPGARTLRLRHAGRESTWCVALDPCATTGLVAHGDKLARHPALRPGPC